jgi:hypothetical protein
MACIRVTNALDLLIHPLFFRKNKEGVLNDRNVSIFATGRQRIKLRVRRGATTVRLPDVVCMVYSTNVSLKSGDVLNLYMDEDVNAHDLYTKIVSIS